MPAERCPIPSRRARPEAQIMDRRPVRPRRPGRGCAPFLGRRHSVRFLRWQVLLYGVCALPAPRALRAQSRPESGCRETPHVRHRQRPPTRYCRPSRSFLRRDRPESGRCPGRSRVPLPMAVRHKGHAPYRHNKQPTRWEGAGRSVGEPRGRLLQNRIYRLMRRLTGVLC